MNNFIKKLIKDLLPPALLRLATRRRGVFFHGNYLSWKEALMSSSGYDSKIILEKTKTALLKVKNGDAVYERDSVLFDAVQYSWPLLSGLLWVAARHDGILNVLDFGGSLGSTYFQNRSFLSCLQDVRWNIVEQAGHVKVGNEYFEDSYLRFYQSIQECLSENKPNIAVLGGVLQYLEKPFEILDEILNLRCNSIIIDRTPFWDGQTDQLYVQHVPRNIYPASYPSWIFSKPKFYNYLNREWKIIAEFEIFNNLVAPIKSTWQGFIIERKYFIK